MVAWSQDRVAAYRLSDGQRVWQQLLPAGATWIHDVASSGTSVVVAYDDRLRALSLTNGGQLWSKANVRTSQIVIADGWVYTNNGDGVSRYSLAAGAAGWSVRAGQDIYRIEAADNDTIYVWNAVFDFGPPSPSVLRALRTTDGSQRWQYNVPSRIGSVAVTGGLVWVTSTEIYSQGRGSDLIALNRLTGVQLKLFHFEDNMYGWTDVGFGAGKAVVHQGGSFGGTTPATLRVFGLAGRRPTIATRVLPIGRVGSAYSFQLQNESGTSTWSIPSGALPAGLSLSPGGLISGTPTGAQSSTVRCAPPAPTPGPTSARSRSWSSPRWHPPGSPAVETPPATRSSRALASSTSMTPPRSPSDGRRPLPARRPTAETRRSWCVEP